MAAEKSIVKMNKMTIEEYFMISHCQGNAKLEYNGGFRAQLGIFTGTRSVKQTLCYN